MLLSIFSFSVPSFPRSLNLKAVSDSEIFITWKEPRFANGIIERYEVKFNPEAASDSYLDDVDVCRFEKGNNKCLIFT